MRVPQVILTLNPGGEIVAELSWSGGRRQVPVSDFETIRRMLAAQLHNRSDTIGTDGAPTVSQVRHWEDHLESTDPKTGRVLSVAALQPDTCVWCLAHTMGLSTDQKAHNRARAILREQRRLASAPFKMGDGSVTVRRIPPADKRIASRKERKSEPTTILTGFDDIDFTQA